MAGERPRSPMPTALLRLFAEEGERLSRAAKVMGEVRELVARATAAVPRCSGEGHEVLVEVTDRVQEQLRRVEAACREATARHEEAEAAPEAERREAKMREWVALRRAADTGDAMPALRDELEAALSWATSGGPGGPAAA